MHGCFHSFHDVCLNGSTSCPLCKEFLKKKVKELGETAKKAILHPASNMHETESQTNHSNETSAVPTYLLTEIPGVEEVEREEFDRVVKQLNDEISNLNPATQPLTSSNLSQSQTYNQTTPSPNKAPPHCRQCHHPVHGHKRLNNAQVKCYFCENCTCTVSDEISSSNCPCSWHTANQHESKNYGQVADSSTRQRVKSSRDVGELVFNPVQLIRR